jgi:hypothetical protein
MLEKSTCSNDFGLHLLNSLLFLSDFDNIASYESQSELVFKSK